MGIYVMVSTFFLQVRIRMKILRHLCTVFAYYPFETGEAHKVDPGRQLVEIMELDYVDDVVSIAFHTLPFSIALDKRLYLHRILQNIGWEEVVPY